MDTVTLSEEALSIAEDQRARDTDVSNPAVVGTALQELIEASRAYGVSDPAGVGTAMHHELANYRYVSGGSRTGRWDARSLHDIVRTEVESAATASNARPDIAAWMVDYGHR